MGNTKEHMKLVVGADFVRHYGVNALKGSDSFVESMFNDSKSGPCRWIEWDGDKRLINDDVVFDVKLRSGQIINNALGSWINWNIRGKSDDVLFFKVSL